MSFMSKEKKRNQYAYDKKAYDHIHLQVPKGKKQLIQDIAEKQGKSINGYIKEAIMSKIEADTGTETAF